MAYLWVINNLIKDYYRVKYGRLLKNTKARQGAGTCRAGCGNAFASPPG